MNPTPALPRCRPLTATLAGTLLLLSGFGPCLTHADLILEFGDPNTLTPIEEFFFSPGQAQMIGLLVHNDDPVNAVAVSGYTLELAIGGGGPPLGGELGPSFTAADFITGTVFEFDNDGGAFIGGQGSSTPQFYGLTLSTASGGGGSALGTVDLLPGRNLVATVTVSAEGFTEPQTWDLTFLGQGSASFFNAANNDEIFPSFDNSSLTVVPEPQHFALVAGLGLLALAVGRQWVRILDSEVPLPGDEWPNGRVRNQER